VDRPDRQIDLRDRHGAAETAGYMPSDGPDEILLDRQRTGMAGVALNDLEIHYMPVAMSGELPPHEPDLEHRAIIFAGGFYPWLNPMPALLDLSQSLRKVNNCYLEIFGGSHEANPEEKRAWAKAG
jgi:hypothetical protein